MSEKHPFARFSAGLLAGWLLLFALVPATLVLLTSLLTKGSAGIVEFTPTLANYLRFLDPVFYRVFVESFKLAFATAVLCLLLGYPFAYLLARHVGPRKPLLLMLVIIPFWTSSLIRTYALVIILKANGVVNTALMGMGVIDEPLRLLYSDTAVLIGLVYSLLPFTILPLYARIEKLDVRLLEAASDLGAGWVARFWHITLPLTMPGIVAGFMLTFLPALGIFYIPDLLGGAKTMLVGNLIRNQFLTAGDWPFGAASSMVLTILMLVLLSVYSRITRNIEREEKR